MLSNRLPRRVRGGFLALAGLLLFTAPAGAITIETLSLWNGTNQIGAFGENNTATYGQTITAPAGTSSLDSFTFWINDRLNPDFVDFQAIVYEWDATLFRATGPLLYIGGAMSTTNNGGADGFESFTINTGGVSVTPGTQYVMAFTASNLFDGQLGISDWATVYPNAGLPDASPGGQFVFMNNSNNFAQLTTQNWISRQGDLVFSATFDADPVPEPSTALLVGFGLAALRRRPRNA